MKITNIEVIVLQKELSSTMQISRGGFKIRNHCIVQIHTSEGITGLGEGIGNAKLISQILLSDFSKQLIGKNPLEIESIRRTLLDSHVYFEQKGSAICAASAIETALWDIKGKHFKMSVAELLGGECKDSIPAYVSDVYWDEPKKMAAEAERILSSGFESIKIHIGAAPPKDDLKRVSAIRTAIGPTPKLLIDLNCGYTYPEALEAVRLWEPYDIYWLEEPLKPHYTQKYSELRTHSKIPIAAGENEFRIYGFQQLLGARGLDYAMPDIGRAGGILECKMISSLAEAHGVEVSLHNFSSGVLLAASIQLTASSPNIGMLEFDSSTNAVYQELLSYELKRKKSMIYVEKVIGLGVEYSEKRMKQYEVLKSSIL